MSAHTPGPWELAWENGKHGVVGSTTDGKLVCFIGNVNPSDGLEPIRKANARLISAAPDMYAVLCELAECSQYWSEYDVPLGIHDRIAAALAKASQ